MTTRKRKQEILSHSGYIYDFDREVYYNPDSRKMFSLEFVEDHDPDEIENCIREDHLRDQWKFYFNSPPSSAIEQELGSALG